MNDHEFEKQLTGLNLAQASGTYLEKGVEVIHTNKHTGGFWHRGLPYVLNSALVLSVSANVFQLVNNREQAEGPETEQLAQCNTPAAAASPVPHTSIEIATYEHELQPVGMC
jgi:hypothetical protein